VLAEGCGAAAADTLGAVTGCWLAATSLFSLLLVACCSLQSACRLCDRVRSLRTEEVCGIMRKAKRNSGGLACSVGCGIKPGTQNSELRSACTACPHWHHRLPWVGRGRARNPAVSGTKLRPSRTHNLYERVTCGGVLFAVVANLRCPLLLICTHTMEARCRTRLRMSAASSLEQAARMSVQYPYCIEGIGILPHFHMHPKASAY
jgi:hypothetical protein